VTSRVEIVYPQSPAGEFEARIRALAELAREPLRSTVDERLDVLNALSDALLTSSAAGPWDPGIPFLAAFLRRSNLEQLLRRELPNPDALDRFVPLHGRKSLRLAPRGVVCHWIAGNVPLLGLLSWAISALVGNTNIIRLSTRQEDLVSPLLRRLENLSPIACELAGRTLVVLFDRDVAEGHLAMSAAADVRIAWGGREAVEAIRALPARWECDDVTLGPRVSLAVVDPALTTDRVLTRLATDVVFFDQLACSSPQRLFVKGRMEEPAFDDFVTRFSAAFERQSAAIGRHQLDWSETYRIELDRSRVLVGGGRLSRDAATQWTLAVLDRPHPAVACANRFLQVIPFERVEDVFPHVPENVQTAITLLDDGDTATFTEAGARLGICRFPRPGQGNHFETPWDGVPMISRLVRWVTRTDGAPQVE
jgi:acyl-CoA reductase-like NAD-dependent aldehyde dehydrogenase